MFPEKRTGRTKEEVTDLQNADKMANVLSPTNVISLIRLLITARFERLAKMTGSRGHTVRQTELAAQL